ncbi:leucine-rich repeat-containing protein 27 [Lynx rufus]|uniref:leucine-rich repeat-containing protein 27 n=1 Tax=Lynx rufus TaxID=61384 RepID=UPI001F122C6E|nr:leucine-rich repeat-containing protein 27 [Lynx rufus]
MDGSGPSELPPGVADPERRAGQVSSVPASPSGEVHQEVKEVVLSSVLDLSQRGLHHLEEIFKIPNIKQLHLQRNALCEIPADFFQSLPNLAWLDFRYNSIRALPSGIGSHKHLKTLLLERNPIKMLPVELGNVTTLRALNLRHCPLEFPAPLVVQKGLGAILAFLQACAMRQPPPRGPRGYCTAEWGSRAHGLQTSNASPNGGAHSPQPCTLALVGWRKQPGADVRVLVGERVADKDAVNSQDRRGRLKEKKDFLPPVEKLNLSELGKSTASPEDWPGEEEIRRFWRLRQEIVEKQREEVLAKQLLPAELPANLKAALNTKEKEHSGSRHALSACRPRGSVHRGVCDGRRKMSSLRSVLPALAPRQRQRAGLPARRAEDSGALAPREQRVRDEGAPREWRERARTRRTAEAALGKPLPPQRSLVQGRQREGSHPVRGPRCPLTDLFPLMPPHRLSRATFFRLSRVLPRLSHVPPPPVSCGPRLSLLLLPASRHFAVVHGPLPSAGPGTIAQARPWCRPAPGRQVVSKIPCAVDLADKEKMPVNPPGNVRQSKEKSSQTSEEMRAFREELWEENLKQHIQKTHQGRKRFQGTAPLKEMSPAARDLEIHSLCFINRDNGDVPVGSLPDAWRKAVYTQGRGGRHNGKELTALARSFFSYHSKPRKTGGGERRRQPPAGSLAPPGSPRPAPRAARPAAGGRGGAAPLRPRLPPAAPGVAATAQPGARCELGSGDQPGRGKVTATGRP